METISRKLQFLVVAALIIGNLFLLSLFLSSAKPKTTAANHNSDSVATSTYDSPNAVTNALAMAVDNTGRAIDTVNTGLNNSLHATGSMFAQSGELTARSGKAVLHGLGQGATFVGKSITGGGMFILRGIGNCWLFSGRMIAGSFGFMIHTTGSIFGFVSNTPVFSAMIKPAGSVSTPTIDPHAPVNLGAIADLPVAAAQTAAAKPAALPTPIDDTAAWPIHGAITTYFGASDWPYQAVHTGIDISDGAAAGVTPVHPFKAGKVIEAVHSYQGLGNHIVVDHGNGLTSVYGHMDSLVATAGQNVDKNSVLGLEGTTGASTGVHVHFEIRVNGQVVNPQLYISGQP
jgi:hypothetical protein